MTPAQKRDAEDKAMADEIINALSTLIAAEDRAILAGLSVNLYYPNYRDSAAHVTVRRAFKNKSRRVAFWRAA